MQSPDKEDRVESDRRIRFVPILLFAAAGLPAIWFFNGGGQNQNATFDLTRAIVEQRTIAIDEYRDNTVDLSFHAGHYYANKAPGLSWIAVPLYATIRPLIPENLSDGLRLTLSQYLVTAIIGAASAGSISLLVYLFGLRWGIERPWALAVALLTLFGTPLVAYSTMLFAHLPSAALYFAALFAATGPKPRPLVSGVTAACAGTMNYILIPLALVPAALMVSAPARSRRLPLFLLGALPFAVLTLIYHDAAFGSAFTTAVAQTNPEFVTEGAPLGVLTGPSLEALWGITFSPYRGLFFLSGFLLFAVAGLGLQPRAFRNAVLVSIAGFLLFNISFNGWHGGYTAGPRYLLPIVPLLALGLLRLDRRPLRVASVGLGLLAVVLNLSLTAVDPQVPETIGNPVLEYTLPTLITGRPPALEEAPWLHDFFTGHVGVNRLTVSERQPFRKFPPGSPEAEWAAFNVGETIFGIGSIWSLLPFLLMEAGLISAAYRRLRAEA